MRIFSGIQPTGAKHLGNYIGAIKQYVASQQKGQALYCIVDLHATTVSYDPQELRRSLYDLAALLIASGLDPQRCVLFRQSDVSEHTELTWLLCSVTAYGDLQRMHQFKDKSAAQRELVSAGLFLYPVLMAADVLAYRATDVPVGDDQRQHVELMRDIAVRFNQRYGGGEEVLLVPEHRIPAVGARIMDLQDPTKKMSTTGGSQEGTIYVLDEPETIVKKVKRAVTDSGSEIVRSPDKPGVSNLIEILAVASGVSPEQVEQEMRSARGYGDLKAAAAEAVSTMLSPVRERYGELRADEQALEATLRQGAERAREIARQTLMDVREVMGLGPLRPIGSGSGAAAGGASSASGAGRRERSLP